VKRIIFLALALVVFGAIGKGIYDQSNKKGAKATRLACHSKSVVFERLYLQDKLAALQEALTLKKPKLVFTTLPSTFMQTKLFEYLSTEDVAKYTYKALGMENANAVAEDLKIAITIYENDKLDPKKKTPEAKLYAGYLVYDFYLKSELVYKIQVDFMQMQAGDVEERVACAIESVKTL
jgi:hypothetical protein